MSRRCLMSKTHNIAVTAGWDPPLQTFFVQVQDLRHEEPRIVKWHGAATAGEIPTLDQLVPLIEDYAHVGVYDLLLLQADWVINDGTSGSEAVAEELSASIVRQTPRDLQAALAAIKQIPQRDRVPSRASVVLAQLLSGR
jgi:hypothetical protein